MIEQINGWMAAGCTVGGIVIGATGKIAWAAWVLSAKAEKLDAHDQKIKDIVAGCPVQHKELVTELKAAVCAGFKLAMKETEQKIEKRLAGHDKDIAVLDRRQAQSEAHIEELFGRLNRRHEDRPVDPDRRG